MQKLYRQLMLMVSVLLFLFLSPLLVLYALGYRLPDRTSVPLPVGVLILETNPRRAEITLNNKSLGNTPKAIPNLASGEVSISVNKEGYTPWHKNIDIAPGEVTEVRDIRLFPLHPNLDTLLDEAAFFSLSPNRKLIAVTTTDRFIHIIDTDGLPIVDPDRIDYLPQQLLWSPDSNSLLAISGSKISALDITKSPLSITPLSISLASSQLAWDERVPGRLLTVTAENNLLAYHIATKTKQLIHDNILHFAASSRYIYAIDATGNLLVLNLQGGLVKSFAIPSKEPIKQLFVTPDGHIAIQFKDTGLALLDEENNLIPVVSSIRKFGWSPDGQLLYIQTDDTSLYVYNAYDERLSYFPVGTLRLITRLSRPIRNPQWFAGGKHLIYQVDDEIIVTEIDTRDHPINYTIDTTNLGDSNITVGAHGESVLYLKKTGQQNRLVSAGLAVKK